MPANISRYAENKPSLSFHVICVAQENLQNIIASPQLVDRQLVDFAGLEQLHTMPTGGKDSAFDDQISQHWLVCNDISTTAPESYSPSIR